MNKNIIYINFTNLTYKYTTAKDMIPWTGQKIIAMATHLQRVFEKLQIFMSCKKSHLKPSSSLAGFLRGSLKSLLLGLVTLGSELWLGWVVGFGFGLDLGIRLGCGFGEG